MKVLVSITGASGSLYAIRLIEELKKADCEIHLIASNGAKKILEHETDYKFEDVKAKADFYYDNSDMFTGPASGSFVLDAMVICPCSMKTLSAVANGYADTLTSRAAMCRLKEEKKLIIVPRETPLDLASIENMKKAKLGGATILPAMPGFYQKPKKLEDIIDFIVGRILDQLEIKHSLFIICK